MRVSIRADERIRSFNDGFRPVRRMRFDGFPQLCFRSQPEFRVVREWLGGKFDEPLFVWIHEPVSIRITAARKLNSRT